MPETTSPPDPATLEALVEALADLINDIEWRPGQPNPPRMIARMSANRLERALVDLGVDSRWEDAPGELTGQGLVFYHRGRMLEDLAGVMQRTGLILEGTTWRQTVGAPGGPLVASPIEVKRLEESARGLYEALAILRGDDVGPKVRPRPAPPRRSTGGHRVRHHRPCRPGRDP